MKKILTFVFVITLLITSNYAFAAPQKPLDLLENGAGNSGKSPKGLETAKGIQKKIQVEIFNVQATSTTASSTKISWDTNKLSDSKVTYWVGTSTASGTIDAYDASTTLNHSIILEELQGGETYSFFSSSEDQYGNFATSSIFYFSTGTTGPAYPNIDTPYFNPPVVTPVVTDEPYITKIDEITGLNNPAGVNVHSNGNLYVADYQNDQVKVYDTSLALIQTLGSTRGSAPGQFSEPWDIAFDGAGDVFITDTNNRRVQVFNASGTLQYTFSTGESYQGIVINEDDYVYVSGRQPEVFETNGTSLGDIPLGQNYYPRNVAIDEGNRVIFSNWGNVSGCCTFDDNSSLTIQKPNGENLQIIDLDYVPAFIDVDSLNRIWVADNYRNKVHVYASDGTFIKTFDFEGGPTSENPSGLEIEGNKLYLTSHVTDKVEIYEITDTPAPLTPKFNLAWGIAGSGVAEFNIPFGVAVGTSSVYVTDRDNHRVQKFDMGGNYISQWGSLGSGNGQFNNADNIAIDSNGNVYVSDWDLNRIQKFDANGNYILQWGSGGPGNGQFSRVYGMAFDSNDNIFVADRLNHRVQKFDSSGNYITQWGSQGGGNGQFDNPVTVAVDSNDNVYITDQIYNRVQKFDNNGNFILSWGGSGSGDGQFNDPYGIVADSNDDIFVVDRGNHRVQKFDSSGIYLAEFGVNGTGDGEFQFPAGLAIDENDSLYVVDATNSRVQKWAY